MPEDTVYNGRFSLPRLQADRARLSRLNGQHHLIYGNRSCDSAACRFFRNQTKHDGHPLLSSIRPYLKLKSPEIKTHWFSFTTRFRSGTAAIRAGITCTAICMTGWRQSRACFKCRLRFARPFFDGKTSISFCVICLKFRILAK